MCMCCRLLPNLPACTFFLQLYFQLSTVVTLVLPQMLDALAPVQPTTL